MEVYLHPLTMKSALGAETQRMIVKRVFFGSNEEEKRTVSISTRYL